MSRLFWKLFLVPAVLCLGLALVAALLVMRWQKDWLREQAEAQLYSSAVMLRSSVAEEIRQPGNEGELQELVHQLAQQSERQMRITLIAADGSVLADSHSRPQSMDNHRNRPEVLQASRSGAGIAQRHSATLQHEMLYVALPVGPRQDPDGFVRVAFDLQALAQDAFSMQRTLWWLVVGATVAGAALSYLVVRRIIRPLEQLTHSVQLIDGDATLAGGVPVDSSDEVGALADAFADMQRHLTGRMAQLRENSERLETVLGNMVEGVLAVGKDERILLANDASQKLLNFATAEPTGRSLLEVTRSRPVHEAVRQAMMTKRPCQSEFEAPGTPRRILALRATCLPGSPCPGAVVVLHDVTELRRLENLRRELVANVSHELKTPLASIKAYAETLRMGAINDRDNNVTFVTRIEEQAERLHQLILDLLQIARIESGQEAFQITDVMLSALVQDCLQQYQSAADAKKISLQADPPEVSLSVRADEEGVRTILSNLVDNAIKYTPPDGQITVRWRADNGHVLLEVRDTGIGIPPAHHSRVFERFYRVDPARSRELGGTGLGLSIVKHLAQAFGGSVGVESLPHQGSTFRVRLVRGGTPITARG